MKRNTKITRVTRRATKNKAPGERVSLRPPPFDATMYVSRRFRFAAASALVEQPVAITDLGDLVAMATSSAAAYRLVKAVRIRSVELWSPPSPSGSTSTASIQYYPPSGTLGNPARIVSDTSMGADRCAYVRYKPANQSIAAMWLDLSATDNVLVLNGAANSIVDIKLHLVFQGQEGLPVAVTAAVAGATVGQLYVRKLDSTQSVPVLPPVSAPTI